MQLGLFGKYILAKSDGSNIDPEAKYFILRYDADSADREAARGALLHYAGLVQDSNPQLASDLRKQLEIEAKKWIN
jgi:hypothetical protein